MGFRQARSVVPVNLNSKVTTSCNEHLEVRSGMLTEESCIRLHRALVKNSFLSQRNFAALLQHVYTQAQDNR